MPKHGKEVQSRRRRSSAARSTARGGCKLLPRDEGREVRRERRHRRTSGPSIPRSRPDGARRRRAAAHGKGTSQRVVVVAKGDKATRTGQPAPAPWAPSTSSRRSLQENLDRLDAMVATPRMMGLVRPPRPVLGPQGLSRTEGARVTTDVARPCASIKPAVEFTRGEGGRVQASLGKASFGARSQGQTPRPCIEDPLAQAGVAKGDVHESVTLVDDAGARDQGRPHLPLVAEFETK